MKIDQLTLKEGDLLLCKNGHTPDRPGSKVGTLKEGEIYTVEKPKNSFGFIEFKEQETKDVMGWSASRFEVVPKPTQFKVGDGVTIVKKVDGRNDGWVDSMNGLVGRSGVVVDIGTDSRVLVNTNGQHWWYNPRALELKAPPRSKDIVAYEPLQTLGNAKKVTIVSVCGYGEFNLLGYIEGDAEVHAWNAKGDTPPGTHYRKIENVPPKKPNPTFVYINVDKNPDGTLSRGGTYDSEDRADAWAGPDRVNCMKVELKEVS